MRNFLRSGMESFRNARSNNYSSSSTRRVLSFQHAPEMLNLPISAIASKSALNHRLAFLAK